MHAKRHTGIGNRRRRPSLFRGVAAARLVRRVKALILGAAALPLFQATGCFPDPIGALNFELQSLVNVTLVNALNTIVQNVLRL